MEAVRKIADRVLHEANSKTDTSTKSVSCWRCFGTGIRFRDNETGEYVRAAEIAGTAGAVVVVDCLCALRRSARAQLRHVPPVFNKPKLSRLKPRADLHRSQATAITHVRANPDASYAFYGKNGVGKSHLAWALYRSAVALRRPVVACALTELLSDFRRVEIGVPDGETLKTPRVTPEHLKKPGKPWLLYFDEFDKPRPTEFAAEQLFKVLDAARSFNHQIVITSNMDAEGLRSHWNRASEVYGNSIMTRLEGCHEVEMF